jgi:ATP-binding cassette subfamily F protein uup
MKNPNFLILDEPTNDLDIVTLETLEDFLLDFSGCVLIVSHDRYFIDKLVDHVFVLEGNGAIKDFPGNYTEYKIWNASNKKEEPPKAIEVGDGKEEINQDKSQSKKLSYKFQRELEELEKTMPSLEADKKRLEKEIGEQSDNYEKVMLLSEELKKINEDLDSKSIRWLEIQEMLL